MRFDEKTPYATCIKRACTCTPNGSDPLVGRQDPAIIKCTPCIDGVKICDEESPCGMCVRTRRICRPPRCIQCKSQGKTCNEGVSCSLYVVISSLC